MVFCCDFNFVNSNTNHIGHLFMCFYILLLQLKTYSVQIYPIIKMYNLVLLVMCTWACRAHVAFSLGPIMRCWFKSSDHFYMQPPGKTIFIYVPNIGPPSGRSFTDISHSLWFVFTFF